MRDRIWKITAVLFCGLELLFSAMVLFMVLFYWPGITYAPLLGQAGYYLVIIMGPLVFSISPKWPRTALLLFWLQPGLTAIIYITNP